MPGYFEVTTRWVQRELGLTTKQNLNHKRMPAQDGTIFSYGSHFPLAVAVRDRRRRLLGFVLNGDRFSLTTGKHQQEILSSVQRGIFGTDYWRVTVPFSALREAGIDPQSVRLVEATDDRWEEIEVVSREFPSGARWVSETEHIEGSDYWHNAITGEVNTENYPWTKPAHAVPVPEWRSHSSWEEYQAALDSHRIRHGEWRYHSPDTKETGRMRLVSGPRDCYTWEAFDIDGEIAYRRTYRRHWLGESLLQGEVSYVRNVKCSRCKGTGVTPGDFITRRVDVEGPRPEGYPDYARLYSHIEQPYCDACGGARRVRQTRQRKAYFLSGFDSNETRPSYFFCELPPKVRPTTVAEAYETLKPTVVRLAERLGRDVKRQGDIYAVPVALDTRTITKQAVSRERMLPLFNTNHVATEQVRLPDGTVLARGTLSHRPQWRRPDHKRVTLGKGWHVIVKNAVPVSA